MKTAVMGGGCFWCIQAVFQRLKGVASVRSGYAGGKTLNPNYKSVCSGKSDHAQVCEITYNPTQIAFKSLVQIFLRIHDPTTLNKQGYDSGTQYRSVILYQTEEEKEQSYQAIKEVQQEKIYHDKVVTEVSPLDRFYPAEGEHQNFYNENTEYGYCRAVIKPKLGKLSTLFKDMVDNSKM